MTEWGGRKVKKSWRSAPGTGTVKDEWMGPAEDGAVLASVWKAVRRTAGAQQRPAQRWQFLTRGFCLAPKQRGAPAETPKPWHRSRLCSP